MNNRDLSKIYNAGAALLTCHTLTPKEAYTVFKFKKTLKALYQKLCQDEALLLAEAGISNLRKHNSRAKELCSKPELNEEERSELEMMMKRTSDFNRLDAELQEEEVSFDGITLLPYESWFILQNENQSVNINGQQKDVLSGEIEELLEGVLWQAPED